MTSSFKAQPAPRRRALTYVGVAGGLSLLGLLFPAESWRGTAETHTRLEIVATLLALFVGAMALVRYYSRPRSIYLLAGVGMLGTAVLDGAHTALTSPASAGATLPAQVIEISPWSWLASRLF
jgi:hypothetical protein